MRNHRVITFAGAGSALAASIAIAAVILVPTPVATVSAATIFASFHETVSDGFTMSFENVQVQGIAVNGRVVVAGADDAAATSNHASAVYFDLHAIAGRDASLLPGLDLVETAAFTPESMWLYARADRLPEALANDQRLPRAYVEMLETGMLVDLQSVVDLLSEYGAVPTGDEAAQPNAGGKAMAKLRTVLEACAGIPGRGSLVGVSADSEANDLFTGLLVGRDGPGDFDRLAARLEQAAGDVSVTRQADGTFLLTAKEFDFESAGLNRALRELVEPMTLSIAYGDDVGLLWAMVEHLGPGDGSARFERAKVQSNDPIFSDRRFHIDGVTTVLDRATLATMLGVDGDGG